MMMMIRIQLPLSKAEDLRRAALSGNLSELKRMVLEDPLLLELQTGDLRESLVFISARKGHVEVLTWLMKRSVPVDDGY